MFQKSMELILDWQKFIYLCNSEQTPGPCPWTCPRKLGIHASHRYMRRKSAASVIRLQIGQSLVDPRQRSQHSLQQACQQPVETVGSL